MIAWRRNLASRSQRTSSNSLMLSWMQSLPTLLITSEFASRKRHETTLSEWCIYILIVMYDVWRKQLECFPKSKKVTNSFGKTLHFLGLGAAGILCKVLELRRWLGNVALFFSGASEKAGCDLRIWDHVFVWFTMISCSHDRSLGTSPWKKRLIVNESYIYTFLRKPRILGFVMASPSSGLPAASAWIVAQWTRQVSPRFPHEVDVLSFSKLRKWQIFSHLKSLLQQWTIIPTKCVFPQILPVPRNMIEENYWFANSYIPEAWHLNNFQ